MVAQRCLHQSVKNENRILSQLLIWFCVVVVATMFVRGFGMKSLGDEQWGGAVYLHIYITAGFFLVSNWIRLDERQCRIMLILYWAGGLLPAVSEGLYLLSRGAIYHQFYFVRPEGSSLRGSMEVLYAGGGLLRFQSAKEVIPLFALALAFYPLRGRGAFVVGAAAVVALFAAGISGHRGAVLYLALFVPTLMLLSSPRSAPKALTLAAGSFGIMILLLSVCTKFLPLPFQRAVSWIPFVSVTPEARWSADVTVTWRLDLWERALDMLNQYWLIGRGVTFDAPLLGSAWASGSQSVEYAIITHNYHNGPITLWVDLGIFGLLIGTMFLVYAAIRHVRLTLRTWEGEFLARAHRVLLAGYLVSLFRFYVIHGDIKLRLIELIVTVTTLEALSRATGGPRAPSLEHASASLDKNALARSLDQEMKPGFSAEIPD